MRFDTLDNNALDELGLRSEARKGEMMMKQVYDFIGRFVAHPSDHARVAHALWCVHAHLSLTVPRIID